MQSILIIFSIISCSLMHLIPFRQPFSSCGNKLFSPKYLHSSSAKAPVKVFQRMGRQVIGLKFYPIFSFSTFFTIQSFLSHHSHGYPILLEASIQLISNSTVCWAKVFDPVTLNFAGTWTFPVWHSADLLLNLAQSIWIFLHPYAI